MVTPRIGKPVEIQALWLNALGSGAAGPEWRRSAAHALASFQLRFWNQQRQCLYDVVDVDHEPGSNDRTLRPNQILAVGGPALQVLVEPYARAWSRRSSASC